MEMEGAGRLGAGAVDSNTRGIAGCASCKLDEDKAGRTIREKRKGELAGRQIAEDTGVSDVWAKKPWAGHGREAGRDRVPAAHGQAAERPARAQGALGGALRPPLPEERLGVRQGPHGRAGNQHTAPDRARIMKEPGDSAPDKPKSGQRKWVRHERRHSNSMRRADYKLLDDGRRFIAYQDDASRFIVGFGVFEEAAGKHAVEGLKDAISRHGKLASVITDRGSQFYANEKEAAARGETEFEKELVALGIRHMLARAGHPQTNGKLGRFHGEIQRKLKWFSVIDELVRWYNYDRPDDSLDRETLEIPAKAFVCKMPKSGGLTVCARMW